MNASTSRRAASPRRLGRPYRPIAESMEPRFLLNGSRETAAVALHNSVAADHAALDLSQRTVTPHAARVPIIGTISGTITKTTNNRGFRHVQVQLIDPTGGVQQSTYTDAKGRYSFKIRVSEPYVVREVTPKGYTQASPTFNAAAPTGSYAPGAGASSWSYHTGNNNPANGPVGPTSWSTIAPAGSLPFESPINITGPAADLSSVLSINYQDAVPSAIIDNGAQIQTQFTNGSAGSITLGGQQFALSQFHYHDTAENQVNGYTYPMEEHFVNVSTSGADTVLGVFLQLGVHNAALDPVLNAATASLTTPGSKTTISTPINFAGLLPASMSGWYYQGSLTTPPLSQVVNWLVFSTPITLDYGQLKQYEAVAAAGGFLPNNRPVQPTDGRQTNEVDVDVNFQGQSVSGLNFALSPTATPATTGTASASSVVAVPNVATTTSSSSTTAQSQTQSPSLAVAQGVTLNAVNSGASTSASSGLTPVAGCNCPLCQALRNATWHQVTLPGTPAVATTPPTTSGAAASA